MWFDLQFYPHSFSLYDLTTSTYFFSKRVIFVFGPQSLTLLLNVLYTHFFSNPFTSIQHTVFLCNIKKNLFRHFSIINKHITRYNTYGTALIFHSCNQSFHFLCQTQLELWHIHFQIHILSDIYAMCKSLRLSSDNMALCAYKCTHNHVTNQHISNNTWSILYKLIHR